MSRRPKRTSVIPMAQVAYLYHCTRCGRRFETANRLPGKNLCQPCFMGGENVELSGVPKIVTKSV